MVGEDPNQAEAEVDEARADKGIEGQEVIQTDLERKGLREKIRERIEERRQYNESKRERKDQHKDNKKADKQRMKEARKRAWNSVKEFGDEHNIGGMIILGLAAEFIVLFVYGGGTVAMNTNEWLITN